RGTVPADGPGRRAAFAAVVAGFWALVVVGFWLANRTQPADAVPPSATTAPAPAPAVQQATEPDRPRSPRGAEATARPAQAPKARPALEQAPQPPASTATGAKPDAAELPADSGLSVEELRKLKSSL
ncbi:MAG: hypothetical protein GXC94_09555, partial [Comamonadaceae bacterium]|nr:hypothetical protein [Comamonadaceae bacterium]